MTRGDFLGHRSAWSPPLPDPGGFFAMPGRVTRRLGVILASLLLVGLPTGVVLAGGGGGTGTIAATIPDPTGAPFTAQLTGTWVWPEFKTPCGPGASANRAAGWAIDWGDG